MRLAISFCVIAFLAAPVFGQVEPYNPYAPVVDDKPPVAADGKLHWPSFFKSSDLQMRFQSLLAVDACQGTNKSITTPVIANRVVIDTMPEGTASGRIVGIGKGTLDILEGDGQKRIIVLHPKGVSRVALSGEVAAETLRPGLVVRFTGAIDEKGNGVEKLDSLEVITLDEKFQPREVHPGKLTSITAQVVSLRRGLLQLKLATGAITKARFILTDDAIAHLNMKEPTLAAVGDQLLAKGHVYTNTAGKVTERLVFASDVTIQKPDAKPINEEATPGVKVAGN
ncbi:MAG: hypothetical protein SFU86_06400 [Pirellulaceae bacterium]|nr:hypothetical protein [Pirellulaceae bacterium]